MRNIVRVVNEIEIFYKIEDSTSTSQIRESKLKVATGIAVPGVRSAESVTSRLCDTSDLSQLRSLCGAGTPRLSG